MNDKDFGMIDISQKRKSLREAMAQVAIVASESTLDRIENGDTPKGDVLPAARTAALMASKTTHLVLPHCHPLAITGSNIAFERQEGRMLISVRISALDRTGVEMEALHAASVAALTIYDMVKFTDEDLRIEGLRLVEKTGGKKDLKSRLPKQMRVALVRAKQLPNQEDINAAVSHKLSAAGATLNSTENLPESLEASVALLSDLALSARFELILTVGGRGEPGHQATTQATQKAVDMLLPGLPEFLRSFSGDRSPLGLFHTGTAGLLGDCLIVNLPEDTKTLGKCLDALLPWIFLAKSELAPPDKCI